MPSAWSHIMHRGVELRTIERVTNASTEFSSDALIVERPLQFVANQVPLMTTMRTPGSDEELVVGFLLSEGVITTVDDVMIEIKPGEEVDVACIALRRGDPTDALDALRRVGLSVSSCGVCGRVSAPDIVQKSQVLGLEIDPGHAPVMLEAHWLFSGKIYGRAPAAPPLPSLPLLP